MQANVVVLHRKALAHYRVQESMEQGYEANLLKYCGGSHDLPPANVSFTIQGRHCSGDTVEQDLMDDLYNAIKTALTKQ